MRQSNTLRITASTTAPTERSMTLMRKLTKKAFLAVGRIVDTIMPSSMLTRTSTKIIPTRVMITAIELTK